ncbi:MAG: hypothetical protein JO339_00730 [Alphaproteobacteria bacterium]|nr:hypothetical protein [Alphaproteobacteria bacterium]
MMQPLIESFVQQVASGKPIPAVPQANVFPMLDSIEYDQLKSNMRKERLNELPIYINDRGHIVDGRNRVRALQELKLSPDPANIVVVPDHKVTEMVITLNIRRRHLTPGQRAAIIAGLVEPMSKSEAGRRGNIAKGNNIHSPLRKVASKLTLEEGARLADVSRRTMHRCLAGGHEPQHKPAESKAIPAPVLNWLKNTDIQDIVAALASSLPRQRLIQIAQAILEQLR